MLPVFEAQESLRCRPVAVLEPRVSRVLLAPRVPPVRPVPQVPVVVPAPVWGAGPA